MKTSRTLNIRVLPGLLRIIVSITAVAVFGLSQAGCVIENPDSFPVIDNTLTDAEQADDGQKPKTDRNMPVIGDSKIIFEISAPFSEKTLEKLRLLFLAKYSLLSDPSGTVEIGNIEFNRFSEESWLLAAGQTAEFKDRLWSEYDNDNFELKLVNQSSKSGPDRDQQSEWLRQKSGPDIFFGSDATVYYENDRLIELNQYLYQNKSVSSENIHVRMLDSFQFEGEIYGLPALVSYPVLMQKHNEQPLVLPVGQAVWSWQLILDDLAARCQILNENLTYDEPETDSTLNSNTDNNASNNTSIWPLNPAQPWATYMQLAIIPEQMPAVWSGSGFNINSGDSKANQNLFSSWQILLESLPITDEIENQDLDSQTEEWVDFHQKINGMNIHQFEDDFNYLNQMQRDNKLLAWLGDSTQINDWQAAVPDLSIDVIPANYGETKSRYSLPLNPRGWFLSDSVLEKENRPDLAAAFISFLSSDPDAYYIMAMEEDLSGFLPPVTDQSIWQTFLSFNQEPGHSFDQWQEIYTHSFINRDILVAGWSEKLASEVIKAEGRWYNQDNVENSIE